MLNQFYEISHKPTHSDRLERWLGKERVAELSFAMKNWYGPPIAVQGVPGNVFAQKGGDFVGHINGGYEMSAIDRAVDAFNRMKKTNLVRYARTKHQLNAFASLSAVIAAATGGKAINSTFNKVGTAATAIGNCIDLFKVAGQPAAGANGAAAPGGTVPTNATVGALAWANAVTTGNSSHFTTGYVTASVVSNSLLLYDRIFAVAYPASNSSTVSVTGVPTRYQNTTSTTAEDYAGGSFVFPEDLAALGATAHNWTVCQYTDQGGTVTQAIPSIAGVASGVINQIDLAVGNWFMPLASGDSGIKALTQMQSSAIVTGGQDFVIGHPIAFMPCPVANMICVLDGINTAFNLVRVYDGACLALLELPKPATTATTYSGLITTVSE